jgi:hypothetical protein
MQKIISFSLWGDNPKYGVGAIINAQLAQKYFPEWKCVFYYDKSVPGIYIKSLNEFSNVGTIEITDGSYGAFWRLFQIQKGNIVLVRDTDSRLSLRERKIVDDWLSLDKKVCVIRDHIRHYDFFILTGMLAVKDGLPDIIFTEMKKHLRDFRYASEQVFIGNSIRQMLESECEVYGIKEKLWMRESYKGIGKDFIGQAYDENGIPIYEGQLND